MKKLYLLFALCLTALMLWANDEVVVPSESSAGDTIRVTLARPQFHADTAGLLSVYEQTDTTIVVCGTQQTDLVPGTYSLNATGCVYFNSHTLDYFVPESGDMVVTALGTDSLHTVSTMRCSDGVVVIVIADVPRLRNYFIELLPPACGNVTPGIVHQLSGDENILRMQLDDSGLYTATVSCVPGYEYMIVDADNVENLPIVKVDGEWTLVYQESMLVFGEESSMTYNWSDTAYAWISCIMPLDTTVVDPSDTTIVVPGDTTIIEPEPVTNVEIVCDSAFTWSGSASDAYFYGTGSGYNVCFNSRTNNLQPGQYTSSDFWTGSYTWVQPIGGSQIGSEDFEMTVTKRKSKTYIDATLVGTDGITYHISMWGINPGVPYEPELPTHTYTLSLVAPESCPRTPWLDTPDSLLAMTADEATGLWTATIVADEGRQLMVLNEDRTALLAKEYRSSNGRQYTSPVIFRLAADTVLSIDCSVAYVEFYDYRVDTFFYRWGGCEDYTLNLPDAARWGKIVRSEEELTSGSLSPASILLTVSAPNTYSNWIDEAPDHGQLTIGAGVNMHLDRFVKEDLLGERSPWSRECEQMRYGWAGYSGDRDGMSSAMINLGSVSADTVQQHTWCYPDMWHFVSLPFDVKRSDIVIGADSYSAIRRFLPAEQAAGNYDGVWEDLQPGDTLYAGEGYIYHFYKVSGNEEIDRNGDGLVDNYDKMEDDYFTEVTFTALPTANKQNIFATGEKSIALRHTDAQYAWNRNWNLVGNPYECFYNLYNCGGSGVIAVYGGEMNREMGGTYSYYSLGDDYYVLQPGEAFFYQAAENEQTLTFPIAGMQMTAIPDSSILYTESVLQAQVRADNRKGTGREIYNLYLSDGTSEDRARVVINPRASMDYEVGRDALKLRPITFTTPQLSVENNEVRMAINERPEGDGVVYLTAELPADGTFTVRLGETATGTVTMLDTETGTVTDLTAGDYTFSASAGTYVRRFVIGIRRTPTELTDILAGEQTTLKVIENGRVIILRGGEKFDILGNKQ